MLINCFSSYGGKDLSRAKEAAEKRLVSAPVPKGAAEKLSIRIRVCLQAYRKSENGFGFSRWVSMFLV